ncbi:MAG TPA: hypothetical protein VHJ39_14030 [Solirubrobacteraceae bacterium]|nr:hypothetical protein [Solirubrobacteraceae bacterium]
MPPIFCRIVPLGLVGRVVAIRQRELVEFASWAADGDCRVEEERVLRRALDEGDRPANIAKTAMPTGRSTCSTSPYPWRVSAAKIGGTPGPYPGAGLGNSQPSDRSPQSRFAAG